MGGIYISAFRDIWAGLDWSYPLEVLVSVIPALICITFHEVSHGFVAWRLGDPTAKGSGRLSLNPLKHVDFMGLVMMAMFHFGWAKPVPVNMYRLGHPKRDMAIVSLAGPVSNILLSLVFMFLYGLVYGLLWDSTVGFYILRTLYLTAYISAALAVFNLIPIPPLDGSKVLFSVLRDEQYDRLMHYERYGMIILVVLIVTDILATPLSTATGWLVDLIWPVSEFAFNLMKPILG